MMSSNPILVEVLRGDVVESLHRGSLVVSRSNGEVLLATGDAARPTFARSAIKLLQALPLVASGAADQWGLSDAELSLCCASHNGETAHTAGASSVLQKAGFDMHVLECGSHPPYLASEAASLEARGLSPCPLHNNCSGKHAGFAALGSFLAQRDGASTSIAKRQWLHGYVKHDHALMRAVTQALGAATSLDVGALSRGVDGCSIPTFAIPLQAMARAFARVATGEGLARDHQRAALRLRRAIASAPYMVAGSQRFDTLVMERLGERVCCKVGAEAVYCAALPEQGLGVALKMDDGNNARAAEVVMASVIEALVDLSTDERAFMQGKSHPGLRNWQGLEVGSMRPTLPLIELMDGLAQRLRGH